MSNRIIRPISNSVNRTIPLTIRGTVGVIHLSRGLHAIVDVEDLGLVFRFRWYALRASKKSDFYAARWGGSKVKKKELLHNTLMNPPAGLEVDHINRNRLDNRRSNLRVVTRRINMVNRATYNKNGFRGILRRPNGKFIAQCLTRRLGTFAKAEDAARAFDGAARKAFGEFAILNFPESEASDACCK